MAITHDTAHVAEAEARLLQQYQDRTTVKALVATIPGQRAQALEDSLYGIVSQRFFSGNPVGQQLDNIGKLVGRARNGMGDSQYLSYLRAQILINKSNGTISELDAIALLLSDPGGTVTINEQFPAGIVVQMSALSITAPADLKAILTQAKAAGVKLLLEYDFAPDAASFWTESVGTFLTGGSLAGDTTLHVVSTAGFALTGSVRLDTGCVGDETLAYSAITPTTITIAAAGFAHDINSAVAMVGSIGLGFGDSANPATGGIIAGVV